MVPDQQTAPDQDSAPGQGAPADRTAGMAGMAALPADPGLCRDCRHALVKETNRGTAYLRCGRAAWDATLVRYPRLPVTECAGHEPADR